MTQYDIAIVGAGCVGCSVAKHLGEQSNLDIAVIEKEYHLAVHQSGRNSGVLHPGFNYPPGSMKAEFSTTGTRRMKAYCRENDIPIDECGVVVVANDDQESRHLDTLEEQAAENGVTTERLTSTAAIRKHEPAAAGTEGLYCPEAASVDSQKYVYRLATDAEDDGADFFMGCEGESLYSSETGIRLETSSGQIDAEYVVNAAGLYADKLAHSCGIGEEYHVIPFRGEYYELVPNQRSLVNSMIYPTPDPELPFLGVHFTRRSDGKVIVGPNAVLAFGREAYDNTNVDVRDMMDIATYKGFWRLLGSQKMISIAWDELNKSYRKSKFVEAAERLVPSVQENDLVQSYAGIRAQLVSEDGALVKNPMYEHGPRSIHILNAVSPGLTSSLPFGERIAIEVFERI